MNIDNMRTNPYPPVIVSFDEISSLLKQFSGSCVFYGADCELWGLDQFFDFHVAMVRKRFKDNGIVCLDSTALAHHGGAPQRVLIRQPR